MSFFPNLDLELHAEFPICILSSLCFHYICTYFSGQYVTNIVTPFFLNCDGTSLRFTFLPSPVFQHPPPKCRHAEEQPHHKKARQNDPSRPLAGLPTRSNFFGCTPRFFPVRRSFSGFVLSKLPLIGVKLVSNRSIQPLLRWIFGLTMRFSSPSNLLYVFAQESIPFSCGFHKNFAKDCVPAQSMIE